MMNPNEEGEQVTSQPLVSDELVGLPRLVYHVKENNVAYLVGLLICYQLDLFVFLQDKAGGMC